MATSLEPADHAGGGFSAEDPLLRALLSGSSLTGRQLEALLLESEDHASGVKRTFEEKAYVMGISRGSYAKILGQALRNVTKSLYTLLLLGYIGLLGERRFGWLIDLSLAMEAGELQEALELLEELASRAGRPPRPPRHAP